MEPETPADIEPRVRVLQTIVGALAMGIVVFGVVVVVMRASAPPAEEDIEASFPLIAYIGIGFALIGVVMGFILPRVIASNSPPTIDTYQTSTIVAGALFEGPAFLNLIAYMLEGQPFSLAIAGIMLVFVLLQLPTVGRVNDWVENRARQSRDAEMFER